MDSHSLDAASSHEGQPDTLTLVDRIQAGDSQALSLLTSRYYPRIRRMVAVRVGARLTSFTELDDLVQGVLLRVLRGVERFERRSDALFLQWVSRLASNEVTDQGRRASRSREGSAEESALWERLAEESRSVVSRVADQEQKELLDSCLAELEAGYQEVLLLRDYAGASWEEVQEELQRPSINACQALYQRARRALGERLLRRMAE